MIKNYRNIIFFFFIFIAAAAIRFPLLSIRPLHTDEAVHAVKLGDLLENNSYIYDSKEYHGPTLNYFTLLPAWLRGQSTYKSLDEFTMRVIPAIFGLGLILLLLLLKKGLGWPIILFAGLFTAFSPAMVFYSRYYIMEILLVFFTFGVIVSGWRYVQNPSFLWATLTGMFAGMMHATKETCVLVFAAMGLAFALTWFLYYRKQTHFNTLNISKWHITILVISGILVSALFFSSFFTNPKGILDSYLTFKSYFSKAGNFDTHIYPWRYYLSLLLFFKHPGFPFWSEGFILLSGTFGIYASLFGKTIHNTNKPLLRFLALFTTILTVIYSIIPYKTPWIALGFLHGFIIMAGAGLVFLYYQLKNFKNIFTIAVAAGFIWLGVQAWFLNLKYYCDPCNPWVYSHPGKDIFTIADKVKSMAQASPEGYDSFIEVICPGGDYWPLPWYLREFPNIGWWSSVDFTTPAAPIIIASPAVEQDIVKKLYEIPLPGEKDLYLPLFDDYAEIRPQVEIRGYVKKELWDAWYYSQP